jgi:hypothetical protein
MRGGFAIVLLSLIGAFGCSDGAADIQATQHGKRLNLVAGDDNNSDLINDVVPATVNRHLSETAPAPAALYRDVAGVVLTDPKSGAQQLEQWILSQDGAEVRSRLCPVKATGGVVFSECASWQSPQTTAELGLVDIATIRSFSTYLFADASQELELAQVVFNMAGDERLERTCPVIGNAISWAACSSWLALEESAAALGVPQQTAFDDEVVVPYLDKQGNAQFTQQLITPSGEGAWARTCSTAQGEIPGAGSVDGCAFSPQVRISALGIHFDAVQGVGGYIYSDNGAQMYAQTVIASDGVTAARRLCPVTPEGVDFEQCLGWDSVDLTVLAAHGSTL